LNHSSIGIYQMLAREIVSIAARKSQHKKLRILEVGAGNGMLTEVVLRALENQNVEYHFTDLGRSFIINAEKEARRKRVDFMKFGILDISKDPMQQGYRQHGFDIILGMNVVHATKSIDETIGNLKSLLAHGGLLCLI